MQGEHVVRQMYEFRHRLVDERGFKFARFQKQGSTKQVRIFVYLSFGANFRFSWLIPC